MNDLAFDEGWIGRDRGRLVKATQCRSQLSDLALHLCDFCHVRTRLRHLLDVHVITLL